MSRINIPSSVTAIGSEAFRGCTSLSSIDIPSSVTKIGSSAFSGCTSLNSIDIPSSVTEPLDGTFSGCTSLNSIDIPCSVTEIGYYTFKDCTSLSSIEIPSSVTKIRNGAFSGCTSLSSIDLPSSITEIDFYVFKGCTSLSSIVCRKADAVLECYGEAFPSDVYPICILYVPESAIQLYKSTYPWYNFANIQAIQEPDPQPGTSEDYMFYAGGAPTVRVGETVLIPVCMANAEENVIGFQCNIKLPEGMEFVRDAGGECLLTWNEDRADDHQFATKVMGDGSLSIVAVSMNLYEFWETDGELFYISAIASEGMEAGNYEVTISNIRLTLIDELENQSEVACADVSIPIEVLRYTEGDLNDDGQWTVTDVTLVISKMLKKEFAHAGDMNKDGKISILDVVQVIQYVLNGGPVDMGSAASRGRQLAGARAESGEEVVCDIVEDTDGQYELRLSISNVNEYKAFSVDIALPDGFSFVEGRRGVSITLNKERLTTHTASQELSADKRLLSIGVTSMKNDAIAGSEGQLLSLKIKADGGAAAGFHACRLSNIAFTTLTDESDFDEMDAYIHVSGTEEIALTIPEGGFATLCLPYAAELKPGMRAYRAEGIENGAVVMRSQSGIEACTPLLIGGEPGVYTFTGDNSAATELMYKADALTGVLVPTLFSEGYVMQVQAQGLGFYSIGKTVTLPAYRCVLDKQGIANAPERLAVILSDDEATGIESAGSDAVSGKAYTIDGREVRSIDRPGLYIVNGMKVMVK